MIELKLLLILSQNDNDDGNENKLWILNRIIPDKIIFYDPNF